MADFSFTVNNLDDLRGSPKDDLFRAEASHPVTGGGTLSPGDRAVGGDGRDLLVLTITDVIAPAPGVADATRCDVVGFTLDGIEAMELQAYDADGDNRQGNGEVLIGMMNVTGLSVITSSGNTANVTLDYLNQLVALDIRGNGVRGTGFTLNYTSAVNVAPPLVLSQSIKLTGFGDKNAPGTITVDAASEFDLTTLGRASSVVLNGISATRMVLDLSANMTVQDASLLPGLQTLQGKSTMTGALSINLSASTNNLKILTGLGADVIMTGQGADSIDSGDGNDKILPGSGQDTVDLGAGNDSIQFSYKPGDPFSGLSLTDKIAGGKGIDRVGFLQAATFDLDISDRFFRDWSGVEILDVSAARASVPGDVAAKLALGVKAAAQGLQTLMTGSGNEVISLTAFNTPLSITLDGGDDRVEAGKSDKGRIEIVIRDAFLDGNDLLRAGKSPDDHLKILATGSTATLDKVTGFEQVSLTRNANSPGSTRLSAATEVVTYDDVVAKGKTLTIDASTLQGTGAYAGVRFDGSRELDGRFTLVGSDGADTLGAGAGEDTVSGSAGNDRIKGEAGSDTLTGGPGRDRFFYTPKDMGLANKDVITDFTPGEDLIAVSGLGGSNAATRIAGLLFAGVEDTEKAAVLRIGSSQVVNDGEVSAVFVAGTETLWIDLNENGKLDDTDLQLELTGITQLSLDDFSIGGF